MKKIVLLLVLTVFSLQGCKNIDFGDYNQNPIGPNAPSPKDLLTGGMINYFNNTGRYELTVPTLNIQWQAQTAYTDEMQYADVPVPWRAKYVQVLSNFKEIIKYYQDHPDDNTAGKPENQIAISKIMMAYVFKELADSYGDIPFSEALDPDNHTPKYDSQIDVYHGIIDMLKEARDMIDVSSTSSLPVLGDIVYNGDMEKWQKFANSLILHAALQLSNVPSEVNYAKGEFTSALNNPAGVLEDVTDDAWIQYSSKDAFYMNPYYRMRRADYALSKEFTDDLQGEAPGGPASCNPTYNHTPDPREQIFSTQPSVDGVPYSCSVSGGSAQMSSLIWAAEAPLPFFLSSWTWLDRAEAAARGWTSEDYDTALTNGINNSFTTLAGHYGVNLNAADVAAYVSARVADANDASYGDGNADPKLIVVAEEKWVAMFPKGFEGWTQWRRLHYPLLQPHPHPFNSTGQIPRRYAYPGEESTVNPDNRAEAVANGLTPAEDRNDSRTRWDQ